MTGPAPGGTLGGMRQHGRAFLGLLALAAVAGLDGGRDASLDGAPTAAAVAPSPSGPPREAPRSPEPGAPAILSRKIQAPRLASGRTGGGTFKDARLPLRPPAQQLGLRPSTDAELLAELTKPAYLHVRLLATPTNHRAPPA